MIATPVGNQDNRALEKYPGTQIPDETEIAQRKLFLELSEADAARLGNVHHKLKLSRQRFADSFYAHLLNFKSLRVLLRDEERLARLKRAQAVYFDALTAGDYGPDYVKERLRVGVVHQRVGLEPSWYLGAYRKYLADMQTLLWELLGDTPQEYLLTYDALLKVVNFDISLALDAYFQAEMEKTLEYKEYAEHVASVMPSGLMVLSEQLLILSMNPAMRDLFFLKDHISATGTPLFTLVKDKNLQDMAAEVLRTGTRRCNVMHSTRGSESSCHLELSMTPILCRSKKLLLVMAENVTDRLAAEARLAQSEATYRLTFSHAAVGLARSLPEGKLLRANEKLCQILGYEKAELLGANLRHLSHPDDMPEDIPLIAALQAGKIKEYTREKRYLHKKGYIIWAKVTMSSTLNSNGELRFIVVFEDISQRKSMEEKLIHLAAHDALTNLPNRALLQDRLSQAIVGAQRAATQFVAVLYIDLDRFKAVNDSLGHACGDSVLVEMANRLSSKVRTTDTVARLGGDEFVVVLPGLKDESAIGLFVRRILDSLAEAVDLPGAEPFYCGASIGVAVFPKDGEDGQTLLQNADAAMYRAKEEGRNRFRFYTSEMNERSLHRLRLNSDLRHALERDEFLLHFQPKLALDSNEIVGMEALLRWQRPNGDIVLPGEFIPIAEESGLIVAIGGWVLRQACLQMAEWQREGFTKIRVAVNLSIRQLKDPHIADTISGILQKAQCPASALELEITESMLMDHSDEMRSTLRELSDLGIHLSLDDFGTGYCNLGYLKRFSIDTLKIDQSFIQDLGIQESNGTIVQALIGLAHNLKLGVVAEGIETPGQLEILRAYGCDGGQGYLFSPPVPADAASKLLREQRIETS